VTHALHRHPADGHPLRGLSLLGRWLLLLLLAFDLAGSPFHAHAHDVGADAAGHHVLHAADSASGVPHVEAEDAPAFGHSLAALRNAQPQPDDRASVDEAPPSRAELCATPRAVASLDRACCAVPAHVARLRDLHVRPDGRAPPPLHA